MESDDDLYTDPISPASPSPPPPPDSPPPRRPPEPEGDPPPSPESYSTPVSLLEWATGKLLCLRTALFVLLGTFGFLQEETLERFKAHERSAGAKALTDIWIDSLWPSKGAFGPNVASTSRASSSAGESSTVFDPNLPSTSKKSFWTGESSMYFGSNVASASKAASWMGASSKYFDPNVPSTSQAASCVGGSSMDFESNVASTSHASSRKRKYPISTPSRPSSDHDEDAGFRIGRNFALQGNPLLKGIEDFCAKYLRHNEVCKEMKDALFDIETIYVLKRNRKARRSIGMDVGKFMPIYGGVKVIRNLAEKIVRDQRILCSKLHYIMRRKARVDQFLREARELSSMAQKDNRISYSMYWIYKNLVVVDRIMERKTKMHIMFDGMKRALQEKLTQY